MTSYRSIKTAVVLSGISVPVGWLWAIFCFPASWSDGHGYNQLGCLIMLSVAHLVAGFFMLIAAKARWISLMLGMTLMGSPVLHLVGSYMQGAIIPFALFVVPALLTIGFGIREIRCH